MCAHTHTHIVNKILKLHVMRVSVFPSISFIVHWRQPRMHEHTSCNCSSRALAAITSLLLLLRLRQMNANKIIEFQPLSSRWAETMHTSFALYSPGFFSSFSHSFSFHLVAVSYPSNWTNFRTSRPLHRIQVQRRSVLSSWQIMTEASAHESHKNCDRKQNETKFTKYWTRCNIQTINLAKTGPNENWTNWTRIKIEWKTICNDCMVVTKTALRYQFINLWVPIWMRPRLDFANSTNHGIYGMPEKNIFTK